MIRRVAAGAAACAVLLSAGGCGDDSSNPAPTRVDNAFASRIVPHQHVAVALAEAARGGARTVAVRRLARAMLSMRARTLPALDDLLARIPQGSTPGDIGVSARQAGDEITPTALAASHPVDAAFLTVMARHDRGALALVTAELQRGGDPAVKAAAQRLAGELTRELARLNRMIIATSRRQASG